MPLEKSETKSGAWSKTAGPEEKSGLRHFLNVTW